HTSGVSLKIESVLEDIRDYHHDAYADNIGGNQAAGQEATGYGQEVQNSLRMGRLVVFQFLPFGGANGTKGHFAYRSQPGGNEQDDKGQYSQSQLPRKRQEQGKEATERL